MFFFTKINRLTSVDTAQFCLCKKFNKLSVVDEQEGPRADISFAQSVHDKLDFHTIV